MKNKHTDYQEDIDVLVLDDIETDLNKKIMVYNDDYNSFEHVIECLMAYCGHNMEQAEQCAWIIHTKGRYAVKEGIYDDLKPIKDALTENGINAKIE